MEKDQHELYKYARARNKQKKSLYFHFFVLCIGSFFLFVANKWLSVYPDKIWWNWVVVFWLFLFIIHLIKVFIISSFMNKHWERAQIDKLMMLQSNKIEQLKYDLVNSKSAKE